MSKRLLDIMLVVVTIPVWLPVLLLVCLMLGIFERGPIFFVHERAGRDGRPFRMLKLRTMNDARDDSGDLLSDADRISPLGSLIRRGSIDEIPQLLNVLKGDMSLVGPRPLLMEYLPLYSDYHRRRHEVLPGITGLAQVSGRNLLPWDERFDLDVRYVDTRSVMLDIRILVTTVLNVLRRHGISSKTEATMHPYRGPGS